MPNPIPTNLMLGFLGAGKTTAILDLLRRKPENETWAVLVNEFGEVGIDGALLRGKGAFVREVPGGCMCCVAGLPMQIGLNRLIHEAKPDRLIIEPTGLGHPAKIIQTLTGEHYRDVIELASVITLVDPRRLEDERVATHPTFLDQVAVADILVANKADLATEAQLVHFKAWAGRLVPGGQAIHCARQGRLERQWLAGRHVGSAMRSSQDHGHHHDEASVESDWPAPELQPWQCRSNAGLGYFSLGWRIRCDYVLDQDGLALLAADDALLRFKAVVRTGSGWVAMNRVDGELSETEATPGAESRLEIISASPLDELSWDRRLRQLVLEDG